MLGRSVRTSQPQGPARIDWSNPICRGLVFAWTPDSFNSPYSPSPVGVYSGTGTARTAGRFGKAIRGGDSGDGLSFAINMTAPSVASGVSFLLIGGYETTQFSVATTSPAGWLRNLNGPAGFCLINCTGGSNVGVDITPAASQWTGDGVLVATTNAAKSIGKSLVNGVAFSTSTIRSGQSAPTANTVNILQSIVGDRVGVTQWRGNGYLIANWVRELSDLEMKSLSDNPWQIFAPDSKALWIPASASVSLPTLVQPSSTTSAGAWTATGAATLHDAINELVPSDTQYISVNSASTTELVLAESAYPGAANQTLAYRASSTQGSTLTVTLKQGVTTIMTRTHALTGTDTLYTQTLTAPEIALITSGAISVTLTTS